MKIKLYQIDAFTHQLFRGNPAAVCPLDYWPNDNLLQNIAAENNLSETAFFVSEREGYKLRWFTPTSEVPLCGHATLAAAYVLFNELKLEQNQIIFNTQSGKLCVRYDGDYLTLDFPIIPARPCDKVPELLIQALGCTPKEILIVDTDPNYYAIFETEQEILKLTPDLTMLKTLHPYGLVVSSKGNNSDCVSRYFAPSYGISEDPATGSIHCTLVPYWAAYYHKNKITALQLSKRGGELICEYQKDRVFISGRAVKYLEGVAFIC